MFSQPELEAVLFARVAELPVEVARCPATDCAGHRDGSRDIEATTAVVGCSDRRRQPVRARYVVGCDGANSTVRGR